MATCPHCEAPLADAAGGALACPHGHGLHAKLADLERTLPPTTKTHLRQALQHAQPGDLPCARCRTPMTRVAFQRAATSPELHIDTCPTCDAWWLDAGEREALETWNATRPHQPDHPPPNATPLQTAGNVAMDTMSLIGDFLRAFTWL